MSALSNSEVTRAGEVLREWGHAGLPQGPGGPEPEIDLALETLIAFRSTFTKPMATVTGKLEQLVRAGGSNEQPTNRLKRGGSIWIKLMIQPTMRLAQMEDIAGCRAVLRDQDEVYAVLARIQEQWPGSHIDDYVKRPQDTGYRAVHVVVLENGRKVEIQLRTPAQNRWADEVEAAGDRLKIALKNGMGPPELLRYFERAAFKLALEERGEKPDEAFDRDFENLRQQVRQYFRN